MIIRWVELYNIRSYSKKKIFFPEGSVLLWGDVGSGKSSILLSIEFALFGLIRGSMSGASLLRHGKKEGYVELSMDVEGKKIIIKRSLRRIKNKIQQDFGYISIDGKNRHGTAVELKSWILDLLGYPKSLLSKSKSLIYRYTVYTPQEETKRILFEDEEQRLDTLRRVFQIDKYKRVRENTLIIVRTIKQRIKELKIQLGDLNDKIEERKRKESRLKELRGRNGEVKQKLKEIKKKVKWHQKRIKELEDKINELNTLKGRLDVEEVILKEKISQQQRNKKEFNDLQKQLNDLQKKVEWINVTVVKEKNIEMNIKQQEMDLNKIREEKIILNEKLSMMETKISELELKIKENAILSKDLVEKNALIIQLQENIKHKLRLNEKIIEIEKELEKLNKQIYGADVNLKQSKELKNKIKSLNDCPVCIQPVSLSHKEHIDNIENKKIKKQKRLIDSLINNKVGMIKIIGDLKSKFDKINEEEKKYIRLRSEVDSLKKINEELIDKQRELSSIIEKKKDAQKRVDEIKELSIEERLEKIERLKKNLERLKERDNANEVLKEKGDKLEELSKNIKVMKKEIGNINVKKIFLNEKIFFLKSVKEKYNKEISEIDKTKNEEKETEVNFAVIKNEIKGLEEIKNRMDKEIKQKEESKERMNKLDEMRDWLENIFIKILVVMEKSVMLKVYNEFNELFKGWFNLLIEEEELTARLSEEFKPIVEQNGYETDITNLSGGEKTALALAYRLSLNKVINDVVEMIKTKNIIILDEPTDGLSTEQLDKMRDILNQLGIKQTIIVSHEGKIESYVDTVLKVIKKEHVSDITGAVV